MLFLQQEKKSLMYEPHLALLLFVLTAIEFASFPNKHIVGRDEEK